MSKKGKTAKTVKMADYNEYENSLDYREAIGLLACPWEPQYYRKKPSYYGLDMILTRIRSRASYDRQVSHRCDFFYARVCPGSACCLWLFEKQD